MKHSIQEENETQQLETSLPPKELFKFKGLKEKVSLKIAIPHAQRPEKTSFRENSRDKKSIIIIEPAGH